MLRVHKFGLVITIQSSTTSPVTLPIGVAVVYKNGKEYSSRVALSVVSLNSRMAHSGGGGAESLARSKQFDYKANSSLEGAAADEAVDGDIGVTVEIYEGEEEEESDDDQVQVDRDSEEDDDYRSDTKTAGAMQMCGIYDDEIQAVNEGMTLNVQDIDAYWLQRKISHAYE
ncbi:hypothetical protein MKW98_029477 [Papaver atlanticum]|uniref:Uncharacterized protein n=1 Tax=Papaver atlanticum TaxID=357466 RepID=A0AAD4XEX4_9MAGN|nr:hypothetical protein MKW98_029477 [Papaver atlanticum]